MMVNSCSSAAFQLWEVVRALNGQGEPDREANERGLNLEFTFEKVVVDIEGTPFAVKVGLGRYQ